MGVFKRDTIDTAVAQPREYSAHRPITAAATKINLRDRQTVDVLNKRRVNQTWQQDAWTYYDAIGEIKYAYKLFTNVLSRIRLYAAVVVDEDQAPANIKDTDIDEATKAATARAMRRVFAGNGQAEILRKAGVNMLVSGECYLIQLPPKYGVRDEEEWQIISLDMLVTSGGRYLLKTEENQRPIDMEELPEGTYIGRIWNSHARYSGEPDSAMKSLVEVCDELFLYSRAAKATAKSRLNAGALLVPDGLSVSSDGPTEVVVDDSEDAVPVIPEEVMDDEFEDELIDHMSTPLGDESSAAIVVPILIRGPKDDLKEVRFIKFERTWDPQLSARYERALERILQGIDLPKDIVTGLANIKYSNAVQIEESLYTAHIEPLVLMLCDVFRTVYLKPALRDAGVAPDLIDRIVIWYDPSAIMTAPDKSNAANIGFDKMALSWEAWRRANGFAEADAPEAMEIAQRLAIQRGQLNEEITTALLKTIMPEILEQARAESIANSPSPLPPGVQQMLDPNAPRPPDGTVGEPAPPPIVTDPNAPPTV